MDNFNKSANRLWKESNTTLSFKDWITREKSKGRVIPNKMFKGVDGIDSEASETGVFEDTLGVNTDKFEKAIGLSNSVKSTSDNDKIFGLNKWILLSSVAIIGVTIAYKIYSKNKKG